MPSQSPTERTNGVVERYLDLLDDQRRGIQHRLAGIETDALWARPFPNKWSIGEHLDHTRVLLRDFRRLLRLLWPLLSLIARFRRDRPYQMTVDDVYERPGFPLRTGWMWRPSRRPSRPVPLEALARDLAAEHAATRAFYQGKDERLLGNARLWDPAIGRLNLIQVLRVGAFHDAHHFRLVERILDGTYQG